MIIVKFPRQVVCLLESEIQEMLKKSPDIWATGLKRGKGYVRTEKATEYAPKSNTEVMKKL